MPRKQAVAIHQRLVTTRAPGCDVGGGFFIRAVSVSRPRQSYTGRRSRQTFVVLCGHHMLAHVSAAGPLGHRAPHYMYLKKISLDGSVPSTSHPTRLVTAPPMVWFISVTGQFLEETGPLALQPP